MGLGGISPWSLVLILVIVLLLFGTKKLRGLGGDLGGALKGFKKAMSDEEDPKQLKADESEDAPKENVAAKESSETSTK